MTVTKRKNYSETALASSLISARTRVSSNTVAVGPTLSLVVPYVLVDGAARCLVSISYRNQYFKIQYRYFL
jgi:hypothetical protein